MPLHGPGVRRLASWSLWMAVALSACSPKVTAPPEPPVSVRRGDEAFHYKQYQAAIDAYRGVIDQPEQSPYTARVMYKTALAQYRLEHYRQTLATLDELAERYPKGHWVQVEALRGDAERSLGNTMVALQDWEKAWKLANDKDRQKLRKRVVAAAQDLSDVELARARRLATDEGYAALLDRQIAARQPPELGEPIPNSSDDSALETADADVRRPSGVIEEPVEPAPAVASKNALASRRGPNAPPADDEPLPPPGGAAWTPPSPAPLPPAAAPVEQPSAPTAKAVTAPIEKKVARGAGQIGCLLPLSGSSRALGERAMRGVRLVFGADSKRLVVADTQGDAAVAARQFEQLAHDPNILAVIGPVRAEEAEAVASRAEELHVPALLLSPRAGLNGRFAVQVGVTRAEQVNGLLDYTMGKIRMRRFGLVYAKDAADIVALFRSEVERRGGTIVGSAMYPTGAQSVMSEAAVVRKWRDRENLQAVFLPGDAAVAAQFAKFLQREMPDVTLLGVHGWESLADKQNRLNGVLFTDEFYARSERPSTQAFVKRFQQAFGEAPGLLEANAYDAASLAEQALAKGAATPSDMLQAFRDVGPIKGATGDVTVTAQGVLRSVFLLQVSGGHLEEIGESPSRLQQEAAGAERSPVPYPTPATDVRRLPPRVESLRDEPLDAPAAAALPPAETTAARLPPVVEAPAPPGIPATAKVACILPLTGPDQAYGKRALAGLRLAFADVPEQLIVRDTGGDPATAADWLAQLQNDPEVVAVVGPLRSAEAEVAAPIAERQRLPLLLLSQREGLGGHYVLQVAMTRTQQVRLLVHYVTGALKLRRFGIVYPNDGYGASFAEAFKKEVANQGAAIVGAQPYPPGTTSFASTVVAVRDWQRSGLDALFIPDAAPTATALAADVRSEMPSVVLLGTESWNDAKSLTDAGSAVDGVIFADAFFADSPRASTREFVARFQQRAGQVPTVFEAQAFDAGMALRKAIAGGATSREQIVAGLSALGTVEGAGELHAAPGGFERTVSLLRYRDGRVEEVSVGATES